MTDQADKEMDMAHALGMSHEEFKKAFSERESHLSQMLRHSRETHALVKEILQQERKRVETDLELAKRKLINIDLQIKATDLAQEEVERQFREMEGKYDAAKRPHE